MKTFHFKLLDETQIEEFRSHARRTYELFSPINGIWHPVYQLECVKMNMEAATFVSEPDRSDEE